jgi:hypothetical protein
MWCDWEGSAVQGLPCNDRQLTIYPCFLLPAAASKVRLWKKVRLPTSPNGQHSMCQWFCQAYLSCIFPHAALCATQIKSLNMTCTGYFYVKNCWKVFHGIWWQIEQFNCCHNRLFQALNNLAVPIFILQLYFFILLILVAAQSKA